MSYSKPMVTIELDEYNSLLKAKQEVEKAIYSQKEDTKPYRKAISAIVNALIGRGGISNNTDDMDRYRRVLESPMTEGVNMSVTNLTGPYYEVYCEMMPKI